MEQSENRDPGSAAGEHLRKPASDDRVKAGVEHRVDELTRRAIGHPPKHANRVVGHVVAGEERNDVGHEMAIEASTGAQHTSYLPRISRAQGCDIRQQRVDDRWGAGRTAS
jgi:hypothetical protein